MGPALSRAAPDLTLPQDPQRVAIITLPSERPLTHRFCRGTGSGKADEGHSWAEQSCPAACYMVGHTVHARTQVQPWGSLECQVEESAFYPGSNGEPRWVSEQKRFMLKDSIRKANRSKRVGRRNQEVTAVSG